MAPSTKSSRAATKSATKARARTAKTATSRRRAAPTPETPSTRSRPDTPDATFREALKTLAEIADGLQGAHANLQEALFHLPRPSEYEPLVEPLRDFARLSPPLVASLAAMPRLASALDSTTSRLDQTIASIEAQPRAPQVPVEPAPQVVPADLLALRLERIARGIENARNSIRLALGSLPTAEDYAPAARQLKELASVSPSLLAWLHEVPKLTTPLADSVDALQAAAESLDDAFVDVEITRRDLY